MAMEAALGLDEKLILLQLAQEAIGLILQGKALAPLDTGRLTERLGRTGASFITLARVGQLRGCVGGVEGRLPLAEDVRVHAIAAAFYDYRFSPLQREELDGLEVEVSVITSLQALLYDGPDDLLRRLRPGIDGVILCDGLRRATFLPMVWQTAPETADFLSLLCGKMGTSPQAWRAGRLQVQTFEVERFSEQELAFLPQRLPDPYHNFALPP